MSLVDHWSEGQKSKLADAIIEAIRREEEKTRCENCQKGFIDFPITIELAGVGLATVRHATIHDYVSVNWSATDASSPYKHLCRACAIKILPGVLRPKETR